MLTSYLKEPNALVISKAAAQDTIQGVKQEIQLETTAKIPQLVTQELEKVRTMEKNEAMRYRYIPQLNSYRDPDHKLNADVPFSYLRRMAQLYPIARACINRRQTQITQLKWDITTIDDIEGEEGYDTQKQVVKAWLKQPMGHKTRFREMLTMMVDDILTLDAICFEYQKRRGGEFMYLIPVDPTTISLRVTDTGATPEPPDNAYVQYIQGMEIASFTTKEMLYEAMKNRTYSPYGFAPLESLIIQVESALRGALFNLGFFKDSNVPDGFITLPTEVAATKTQVEEWQMWFDAIIQGDPRFLHKLKILPGGAEYTKAQTPEDMKFERFELWLLQQTCAVFDVQPQDIGITYQVNKATGDTQQEIGQSRGLLPLAGFLKEVIDSVIQEEMGFPELQLLWTNINPTNKKEEAEIAAIEIPLGVQSVDEYRIKKGDEPIGLDHFIHTTNSPVLVKDFLTGKPTLEVVSQNPQNNSNPKKPVPEEKIFDVEMEKKEHEEIKLWRKCVYRDIESGKGPRNDFISSTIRPQIVEKISKGIRTITNKEQARIFFEQFLDPEIKASLTLLEYAQGLRKTEHDITSH